MQKVLLIISLFALAGFTQAFYSQAREIESLWETWKLQHEKSYPSFEESIRFGIFSHNYKKILKFNEENDTPKLALNHFADLTASEFKERYVSSAFPEPNPSQEDTITFDVEALPQSVDWRSKGAVTPVKDQGQCGACYAFATTGIMEGYYFINNGELLSFSEQQVADCTTSGGNQGCESGTLSVAAQYAIKYGLETEADYPYTGADGTCHYNATLAHRVSKSYKFVTANSTDQLKSAVVQNPVAVLIEADQEVFQFYSTGIIKTGCGASLDHYVLVVGYHKVGVLESFIAKNSWGAQWGDTGYVQIWSNNQANGGQGVCGILAQPLIPTN